VAKILVADDNSNIQKMVGLALKDQGIDVVAVGNGEAAVRKISDVKPDLVLADVFMPVRNGYEVCRYVKEDSSLSHIPVILLVGAFDPLDEQEAQRVGADGVLKKPFVPPDPLISMVKSALARAGVPLGSATPAEKPAAPARSTADILSGNVTPKIGPFAPPSIPEVPPEPLEEFATPREQVKIAAGHEPVAFGSLLETPEEEDVSAFSSAKPMIEIAKNKEWNEEAQEVPEEEEEESPRGGWRPGGLDQELERAAKSTESVPDWRDLAFHGNSPAKSNGADSYASAHEPAEPAVATAEAKAVAVTTLEAKPVESALPFSGDAWAAAMAAGIEEKLVQPADPVVQPETVAASNAETERTTAQESSPVNWPGSMAGSVAAQEIADVAPSEESKAPEPMSWAAVLESPWEAEAKRASMLASTWDAPAPVAPSEDTQELPTYSAEQPEVHAEIQAAEDTTSAYSGHYEPEPESEAAETPAIDTSAEVAVEAGPSNHFASNWEVAAEAPAAVAERAVESAPEAVEAQAAEPSESAAAAPETAAQPDMDELVARVLGKMNPEVLQKVTREILKPVIEAIIRDELDAKKP